MFFRESFWICKKHAFLKQNSQTSKEIGVDISIFLGYSIIYRHIVKHCYVFALVSLFNLQNYVSSHAVMAHYQLAGHIENRIFMIRETTA